MHDSHIIDSHMISSDFESQHACKYNQFTREMKHNVFFKVTIVGLLLERVE